MPVTLTLPPGESGSKARRGALPGRYRVRPSRKREGKVEKRNFKKRERGMCVYLVTRSVSEGLA